MVAPKRASLALGRMQENNRGGPRQKPERDLPHRRKAQHAAPAAQKPDENTDSEHPRPLKVMFDVQWTFDPIRDQSHPEKLFKEAEIGEESLEGLRVKFDKFSFGNFLELEDWISFNKRYSVCAQKDCQHFFRAMDRSNRGGLSWEDFQIGCCAAHPFTPNILNSFTGYFRARCIFDFYSRTGNGMLVFDELAKLLADKDRRENEEVPADLPLTCKVMREQGEVSVVSIRIQDVTCRPVTEFRTSFKYTCDYVLLEAARRCKVPVKGLELLVGEQRLIGKELLENFVHGPWLVVTLAGCDTENWPTEHPAPVVESVTGIERLAHMTFQNFYQAMTSEKLRGTSRLFRFQKNILATRLELLATGVQRTEFRSERNNSGTRQAGSFGGA